MLYTLSELSDLEFCGYIRDILQRWGLLADEISDGLFIQLRNLDRGLIVLYEIDAYQLIGTETSLSLWYNDKVVASMLEYSGWIEVVYNFYLYQTGDVVMRPDLMFPAWCQTQDAP